MVSNNYASIVASKISFFIQLHMSQHNIEGYVSGADSGYQIGDQRYIPDVAFISRDRQPEPSHETCNPNPPDLAVEVLSPTDPAAKVRFKIASYLAAGTIVWLVNADEKHVEVYVPGKPPKRLYDLLDGGDVLPGLRLPLYQIFPD